MTRKEEATIRDEIVRVHREARNRIKNADDKEALLFGQGYLTAVRDIAVKTGNMALGKSAIELREDLELAYYRVEG